ncbi:GntR family transcriptional regulator [Nioella sp.]|jgi:GntR family transcriptional regulator|uniref:GntR family transcriptional regulator n=1 Tax=Nioella sp. TaxID=1912091 RepID=UPI003517EBB4
MPPNQPGGALPIYLQISEMLIRDIAAGRLMDGSRLPPEREMAKSLDISVGTLRKALSELENRGLLDRRQGSGNYIRSKATPEGIYAFFRLELVGGGGLPTAQVLDVARMQKPADLPRFGASIEAHRIRRMRFLGGEPAAVEEIWLDASHADRIDAGDLLHSLYMFYRETLDLWITGYEDQVGVASCPEWAPPEFGPRPGAPCGLVERQSRARDGSIAEVSRNWFDSNVARYVARMR